MKSSFLLRFSHRGIEFSPSRERKQKPRMFLGHQALNPPQIQQSGSVSPNRVAASTNTEQQRVLTSVVFSDNRKEISRAIPVPPIATTQSSRARNSVEGFNTEIEKLVCRGNGETTTNKVVLNFNYSIFESRYKPPLFSPSNLDDGTYTGWPSCSNS